ncbi:MAG TPA: hypothetical protein VNM90_12445, partial [Haliangium sp.]|nr:hypothetical protein [Haliangium sp.]
MQRTGNSLVVLLLVLAVAGAGWLGTHGLGARARAEREAWPEGEGLVWLPPPRAAPIVAMGYRQLWAD